jgi:hypothetical protein
MCKTSNFKSLIRARALRMMLCLVAVVASARVAAAEPVQTIVNNGDPANRVDIVILGDGYTAAEMSKYQTDVQQFVQSMFQQEPLREYQRFFNVHRIDVASAESGSDHPENGTSRNTAFDSAYNCGGIQRLICANNSKVSNVVNNSLTLNQRDLIILIVNDPVYGGSGGLIAIASTNVLAVELVLHESGHTFGLLADEYSESPPTCSNSFEPSEANVTRQTARASIKWNAWIDASTPVPTSSTQPALPGLYEGARYCTTGLYRPTFNSKMRSLGLPFEQVNSEQLVRRVYNSVSPVDSFAPANTSPSLTTAQSQTFSVTTPAPLTHALSVSWTVDGRPAGTSSSLNVGAGGLSAGSHTIEATVRDQTSFVRSDPEQLLVERVRWNVTVTSSNLVDGTEFFVTQHYRDFLSREPDAAGLQFWTQGIESCVVDAGCREAKRVDTSAAFFLSIEFQETGYLVYRTYLASFGNISTDKPVPLRFGEFLPDTQQIGQGVVVNSPGWEQALEANKQAYFAAFVARDRFKTAYPTTLSPSQFVGALFTNAGVAPTVGERQAAINEFGAAADTSDAGARARALRRVAENAELARKEFNRAFVLMQYFGYLRRNPDDAPEQNRDFAGYNFWLGKLNQFNGDHRAAEMVKAFITSIEYRQRFGTP